MLRSETIVRKPERAALDTALRSRTWVTDNNTERLDAAAAGGSVSKVTQFVSLTCFKSSERAENGRKQRRSGTELRNSLAV